MAMRHYSKDELLRLRDSPLVQRPDNLPSIEQWIEYVYVYTGDSREKLRIPHSESQQTQTASGAGRRQPPSKAGGDVSPMGNFSAGVRPSLMPRTTASRSGEDISLGPPRTMFPSSRNTAKLTDFEKATTKEGEGLTGEEQEAPRSKFLSERANRKSMNEKEGRDNRESWTSARERRALGGDDEQKPEGRFSRRDRGEDGERRNGFGEKHDGRWGEKKQNGERHGGWRERERDKKDKDWERGVALEKEPEWMDDPAPAAAEDDLRTMGMPRNQEQFQKWKEAMSGKKPQNEEVENALVEVAKEAPPAKTVEPLKLEGVVDKPFGGWGDGKASGNTPDTSSTPVKSVPAKSKGSRFASMFKESQASQETPPAETAPSQPANGAANGNADDEAGFKRILQMLGGTGLGQPGAAPEAPSSPPARTTSDGTRKTSRFTSFFDQTPKSPERMQSPPEGVVQRNHGDVFQGSRGVTEEPGSMFGGRLQDTLPGEQISRAQMPSNIVSAEPPLNGNREHQVPPGRTSDVFLDQQPPSRGAATPDVNIQNLLASQRVQKPQGQDKNSQYLLNLLQEKGSRPSSQQARQDSNFSLWLEQPPSIPEPHAPKPRAPPPSGFIDDQLLRNAPPEPARQDQQMLERRTSQRAAPPGFFDEQASLFMQQQQQQQYQQQQQAAQRRNFTEPPQQYAHQQAGRRMSGHPNLPPMQIPQPPHQQFAGPMPPEFLQSPQGGPPGGQQAPPPGFNPHMPRHPPGFHNIPNIFQPPQQQQQRNDIPSGFPGGPQVPQGMPGSSAGGMSSPPNAPPGFYGGPPGMPPPGFMGMRSPNDTVPPAMRGGGRGYEGGYDGGGMGPGGGPRR